MIRFPIAMFRMARVGTLAVGVAAILASAGCERSQPGPKPISGDTPAAADTAPSTSPPARKE